MGKALWYEEYADTVLFHAIAPCYYQTVLVLLYMHKLPDQKAIDDVITNNLPPVANYLENELINKIFLIRNRITIADAAVASMFMNMYLSGFPFDKEKWLNLSQYLEGIFKRKSFSSCVDDLQIELKRLKIMHTKSRLIRAKRIRAFA